MKRRLASLAFYALLAAGLAGAAWLAPRAPEGAPPGYGGGGHCRFVMPC